MQKLNYFNPLYLENGYIFSCDGVRVKYVIDKRYIQEFSSNFFMTLRTDIENYPISIKQGTYKHLAKITYGDDASMTFGFCFNGASRITENGYDNMYLGMMDFNLNKVGSYERFWADYREIKSLSSHFEIVRVDMALDVPIARQNIILEKDSRVYEMKAYSLENKTEYLGVRNSIGRVKIYNKSKESKLDKPLTRIEVTCELDISSYIKYYPKIYNIDNVQCGMSIMELNDTDRAILDMENKLIVNGLDDGLMTFNSLAYIKKQKLKPYILPESSAVGLIGVFESLNNAIERYKSSLQI